MDTKKWNKAFPNFADWITERDAYDIYGDLGVVEGRDRRKLVLRKTKKHPAKYWSMLAKGAQGTCASDSDDKWSEATSTLAFSSDG